MNLTSISKTWRRPAILVAVTMLLTIVVLWRPSHAATLPSTQAKFMAALLENAADEIAHADSPGMAVVLLCELAKAHARLGNVLEAHRLLGQAHKHVWGRSSDSKNIFMLANIAGTQVKLGLPHAAEISMQMAEELIKADISPDERENSLQTLALATVDVAGVDAARVALRRLSSQRAQVFVLRAMARQQAREGSASVARATLREAEALAETLDPKAQEFVAESLQKIHLEFVLPTDSPASRYASPRLARLIGVREALATKPGTTKTSLAELLTQQPYPQWTASELVELFKVSFLVSDLGVTKQSLQHAGTKIAEITDARKRDQLYAALATAHATMNDYSAAQETVKKISSEERLYAYNRILAAMAHDGAANQIKPTAGSHGTLVYLREAEQGYEIIVRDLATMRETVVPDTLSKLTLPKDEYATTANVKLLDALPDGKRLLLTIENRLRWMNRTTGEMGDVPAINSAMDFVEAAKYSPDGKTLAVLGGSKITRREFFWQRPMAKTRPCCIKGTN